MILFLSPYPPRECGLAHYTHQLVNALEEHFEQQSLSVAIGALEESCAEPRLYPEEVRYILPTADRAACQELAQRINKDTSINAVCIQHRFGLWGGGRWGEHVLAFANALEKPLAVVLHNVLPEPEPALLHLIAALAERADLLIAKSKYHANLLRTAYSVIPDQLRVIPAAAPIVAPADKVALKTAYKLQGRLVLTYFGYLRRSKGLEHVLEALDEIRKEHPTAILLLLGPTHQLAARFEGERYRIQLKDLIFRRGLQKHVFFLNRILSLKELQDYLCLTDVYLHISKNNAGSLLQAMGCGCSIVATPSPVTQELLPDKAGVLVEPANVQQLSAVVKKLFSNEALRNSKGELARQAARQYAWPNISLAYQEALTELVPALVRYKLPALSAQYLKQLTTPEELLKTNNSLPEQECAPDCSLADNARALLASFQLYAHQPDAALLNLMSHYLKVIQNFQQTDGSFTSPSKRQKSVPTDIKQIEEAAMQALWALGYLNSQRAFLSKELVTQARDIFAKALPHVAHISTLRAAAYAIKALYFYNLEEQDTGIKSLLDAQATKLLQKYKNVASKEWSWFEKGLHHANSILPEALLLAWEATGKEEYRRTAMRSFKFLLNFLFMDGPLPATGRHSLQMGGEDRFGFSNHPLDVAETILSLNQFYEATGEEVYLDKMYTAFSWFLGNNHIRQVLYSTATGSCSDGIEGKGVKHSQSASSLVYYLLSRLVLEEHAQQQQSTRSIAMPVRKHSSSEGLDTIPADRPSMPSERTKAIVR